MQQKIDSLWYNDIDYASILDKQLCLKKDVEGKLKKLNKLRLSHFLNRMLMHNIRNKVDMDFVKKVFTSYKHYYMENHDQTIENIVSLNNELKK